LGVHLEIASERYNYTSPQDIVAVFCVLKMWEDRSLIELVTRDKYFSKINIDRRYIHLLMPILPPSEVTVHISPSPNSPSH
jgi:hypothetical protein